MTCINEEQKKFELRMLQHTFKTSAIIDNGFNPMWNHSTDILVHNSQFAFLNFKLFDVKSRSTSQVASFAICLNDLKFGYRYLPLFDINGNNIPLASILVFMDIQKVDY